MNWVQRVMDFFKMIADQISGFMNYLRQKNNEKDIKDASEACKNEDNTEKYEDFLAGKSGKSDK